MLSLTAAIRPGAGSIPALSKEYFKTATNDTVKGFDAVHVVTNDDNLGLWLGESKFYRDYKAAVRDVAKELIAHTEVDYLRTEFLLISNKIQPDWPHAEQLQELIDPATSLDIVFDRLCIPVLLTYDSKCVESHIQCDAEYEKDFEAEMLENHKVFLQADWPKNIDVHLFLLPLYRKEELVEALNERLKLWQNA